MDLINSKLACSTPQMNLQMNLFFPMSHITAVYEPFSSELRPSRITCREHLVVIVQYLAFARSCLRYRSMTLLFHSPSSNLPRAPFCKQPITNTSLNDIGRTRIKNFYCSFFGLCKIGFGLLSITTYY